MGKKRIKIMGAKEAPKEKKGRKIVKTGKEHGRITDVGAEALAEAATIEEKARKLEKEIAAKTKEKQKVKKKAKVTKRRRSKRYQAAKKLVDRTKLYPLPEAIKLVKKTSIAKFNGSMEVHLVIREKRLKREIKLPHPIGKQTKLAIASEKKAPLVHLVIGKLDVKDSKLAENFQAIIKSVGPKNIKKAVLTSTMGPGIKVDLASMA